MTMQTSITPRFVPSPYQDSAEAGRLILRDGSTADVRLADPKDRVGLAAFFERLSPESRRRRFSSLALPGPELVATLCECSNPRACLTLLVTRTYEGTP